MRITRSVAHALALLASVFGAASSGSAASLTYNVNQTIGTGGVTGDIVTDGTIGVLAQADILGYDLLVNDGTATPFELNSAVLLNFFPFSGSDLSATPTQLLFNFSGTDGGVIAFADASLDFQVLFCTVDCFDESGAGETIRALLFPSFTFDTQFTSLTGTQVIGTVGAPEPSTLAFLGGGIIALLGLRKQKLHRKIVRS